MTKDENSGRKWAIGAIIAAIVGYITGFLTAPQSGKQTRADIADQLQKAHDELDELIEKAKTKGTELGSKARSEFDEAVLKAKKAKGKAGSVLEAVRKGKAKDPELNAAVKQARQAKDHLGKYLKG